MKAALSFLTLSLICTLIYGIPTPRADALDSFDVDDECADGGNEATKEACNGKLVSKDELSSSIKSNLNKIGVTDFDPSKKGEGFKATTKKFLNKAGDKVKKIFDAII